VNSISLHLFTNSTINAPSIHHIETTYNSLIKTFGIIDDVHVWCDPNPNLKSSEAYINNLKTIFCNVEKTTSLSDGYVKALKSSKSDFMFMMEHDWIFVKKPDHTLQQIMFEMIENNLWYMRFNRRANVKCGWDKWIEEKSTKSGMLYCTTPNLSNNPHLIHRLGYMNHALPLIKVFKGPHGIEEKLLHSKLVGNLYGGLNHPQMIDHTDGRKQTKIR
jgi:hypothetical protein